MLDWHAEGRVQGVLLWNKKSEIWFYQPEEAGKTYDQTTVSPPDYHLDFWGQDRDEQEVVY